MNNHAFSTLHQLVAQACETPAEAIRAGDRLAEDLGLDSLELAGLLLDIETTFGTPFTPHMVQQLSTVADLQAIIDQQQGQP